MHHHRTAGLRRAGGAGGAGGDVEVGERRPTATIQRPQEDVGGEADPAPDVQRPDLDATARADVRDVGHRAGARLAQNRDVGQARVDVSVQIELSIAEIEVTTGDPGHADHTEEVGLQAPPNDTRPGAW